MKIATAALMLFLSGCNVGEPSVSPAGGQNYGVREIRLKDGTRCVIAGQRSISCDWETGRDE